MLIRKYQWIILFRYQGLKNVSQAGDTENI